MAYRGRVTVLGPQAGLGPGERSRFAKWLHWRLEATGHQGVITRRTYQLLNARRW